MSPPRRGLHLDRSISKDATISITNTSPLYFLPGVSMPQLCGLEQVTQPLWALVSSSAKQVQGRYLFCLRGLLRGLKERICTKHLAQYLAQSRASVDSVIIITLVSFSSDLFQVSDDSMRTMTLSILSWSQACTQPNVWPTVWSIY